MGANQDLGLTFMLLCGETGLNRALSVQFIINAWELVSFPKMPLNVF